MENTNLSKQQQVSEIMRQMLTQAQTAGQYFTNDQIKEMTRKVLRVSGIVMRLRMFLLLITFLKASHSFRNRLLVICKNAYLFATMIMTSVSSPFSCCSGIVRLNLM